MVANLLDALLCRLTGQVVGDQAEAFQIVEGRFELLVEERQPVLHAGVAAAFADRLVKGVITSGSAEEREIVAAKAADRVLGQHHLAHGVEFERAALADRALGDRVEGPHRLERVAEEIEPERLLAARYEDVENAAPHRIFADFANRRHALEAVLGQARGDILHRDAVARLAENAMAESTSRRRHLLQERVDRDKHDRRVRRLPVGDEPAERRKTTGRRLGARRDPVIGQAVPARQRQDRNFRCDETQHLLQIEHLLPVRDHVCDRMAGARHLGKQERLDTGRHTGKRRGSGEPLEQIGRKSFDHSDAIASLSRREKSGR